MADIVALTGATGFIGRAVLARLVGAGRPVRALVRRTPNDLPPTVEPVVGDLRDDSALARLVTGVACVLHIAGATAARGRAEFLAVNAEAAGRLAGLVSQAEAPPRFVLVSSLAAREPGLSDYAASKRAGEDAVRAALGAASPVVLRPPAVYGPGDRATLGFFRLASRGIAPVLGRADARFSLLYVSDLARLLAEAAIGRVAPGLYEPDDGTSGGYAWPDLAAAAGAALGRTVRPLHVPAAALWVCAAVGSAMRVAPLRPPILSLGKARELRHRDWLCASSAQPDPAVWRPQVELRDGYVETLVWYRRNGWL
jgi:nucleoside-diphosphate-sugar epimerase